MLEEKGTSGYVATWVLMKVHHLQTIQKLLRLVCLGTTVSDMGVQCWEHLPPTNAAQVRFPDPVSAFPSQQKPTWFDRAVFNWVSKVICELLWFMITSLSDWFKALAPLFYPIRSETKTNPGSRVRIFPRFESATCNYFEVWLVYRIVSVLLLGQSNYFGFGFRTLDWNSLYVLIWFDFICALPHKLFSFKRYRVKTKLYYHYHYYYYSELLTFQLQDDFRSVMCIRISWWNANSANLLFSTSNNFKAFCLLYSFSTNFLDIYSCKFALRPISLSSEVI